MASRLSVEPTKLLDTLKATVFRGASNEELLALVAVSNRYGLDPLTKQIYAFPSKGGITPVVSIDGWLHILNTQPQFDGLEFHYEDDADGKPFCVTAIVHRRDRTHPTKVPEYYSECYRPTEPWKQFPRRMLRHKAIKEAVRVAFGISGITDEDEARDSAMNSINGMAMEKPAQAKPVFTRPTAPTLEMEMDDIPMDSPQASAAAAPKPRATRPAAPIADEELPIFEADTPQKTLALAISDASVSEADFMRSLRKYVPAAKKAATLSELTDHVATEALKEIDYIIRGTEEAAQ